MFRSVVVHHDTDGHTNASNLSTKAGDILDALCKGKTMQLDREYLPYVATEKMDGSQLQIGVELLDDGGLLINFIRSKALNAVVTDLRYSAEALLNARLKWQGVRLEDAMPAPFFEGLAAIIKAIAPQDRKLIVYLELLMMGKTPCGVVYDEALKGRVYVFELRYLHVNGEEHRVFMTSHNRGVLQQFGLEPVPMLAEGPAFDVPALQALLRAMDARGPTQLEGAVVTLGRQQIKIKIPPHCTEARPELPTPYPDDPILHLYNAYCAHYEGQWPDTRAERDARRKASRAKRTVNVPLIAQEVAKALSYTPDDVLEQLRHTVGELLSGTGDQNRRLGAAQQFLLQTPLYAQVVQNLAGEGVDVEKDKMARACAKAELVSMLTSGAGATSDVEAGAGQTADVEEHQ